MRIGIFGGTFNPIHNAHVQIAAGAKSALALDLMLLIPTAVPPHKQFSGDVDPSLRLSMVKAVADSFVTSGMSGIAASDIELIRGGKSYTVDTLEELHRQYPKAELFMVIGSDMLSTLPTWYQSEKLFRLATFACVAREGQSEHDAENCINFSRKYGAKIRLLSLSVPPFSSTEIRRRIQDALPVSHMIPPSVERIIYQNGLYLPDTSEQIRQYCQQNLSPHRYIHTINVMRLAIELADYWQIDPIQARTAALLHDCGKRKEEDPFAHAKRSECIAKEQFGINDPMILQAIRRHTTGSVDMSKLDEIIYLADMLEESRDFPHVEELRKLLFVDLDQAMKAALQSSIAFVRSQNLWLHPDSLHALQWLENKQS